MPPLARIGRILQLATPPSSPCDRRPQTAALPHPRPFPCFAPSVRPARSPRSAPPFCSPSRPSPRRCTPRSPRPSRPPPRPRRASPRRASASPTSAPCPTAPRSTPPPSPARSPPCPKKAAAPSSCRPASGSPVRSPSAAACACIWRPERSSSFPATTRFTRCGSSTRGAKNPSTPPHRSPATTSRTSPSPARA